MRCPFCEAPDTKVIDSRLANEGDSVRRRRECLTCGYRYTTYEQIERTELLPPARPLNDLRRKLREQRGERVTA